MKQSEASFQRRVLKDLKKLTGLWVYKAADRAKKGIPDLIICAKGRFLAIELKAQGEKPTLLQAHTLADIKLAGGEAFHVEPSDWPTTLKLLTEYLSRIA